MITEIIIGFTSAILSVICAYSISLKDLVDRSTYIALTVIYGLIAILCATILLLFS
ncbi:hypothetical protein LCGC14_1841850 [marine sediment metagenome]|uniref:Uncharacterized protein n=1 Tax=marine sediment metagenome TaxID=412755 RepID=A0A0F9H156_9ZZZZ